MENFLKNLPQTGELMRSPLNADWSEYKVNGHIHTPYSFSAFSAIEPIFKMAAEEGIKILGINDFYTTGGFREFHDHAVINKVFPLFNIEFIALNRELQGKGIRVNDPNNPGRTYFSGKGLDFPDSIDSEHTKTVESVKQESQQQVETMVEKTNAVLLEMGSGIQLNFQDIRKNLAKDLVRERHIAQALRISIFEKYASNEERTTILSLLYGGKESGANPESNTEVEIEIRNNLLKAGGRAFVEEDEKAFLPVESVIEIITGAGGIPCYPVLLDDPKGNITAYESDKEALARDLTEKGISCIELIPGRNDAGKLEDFVQYFHSKGFIVLFGTEHNTPDLIPLTVSCRHGVPLSGTLQKTGLEGACIIAAHQYLRANGLPSRAQQWQELEPEEKKAMIHLGKAVVYHFINS